MDVKMKFNDAKLAAKVVMMAGRVPMLQGERGIGKSTMAKEICREEKMIYINIDCNLLKEGELGGLPISEDRIDAEGNVTGKKTAYAPYAKLLSCLEECERGNKVLLFLDEMNRAETAVIQESMNLILNREINGLVLPKNCFLMGAMNPPGSNNSGEVNYNVTEMDAAAMDRFVWLELESNLPDWLDWAVSSVNVEGLDNSNDKIHIKQNDRTQNVHNDIIEFLTQPENKDLLNVAPTELNPITSSPRSWEMLSDCLFVYEANTKLVDEKIFLNIAKGCVGSDTAIAFIRHAKDNSNPLPTAEQFLKMKDKAMKEFIESEQPVRLFVMYKNVLNFFTDAKSVKKEQYEAMIDSLKYLKADTMVSIMKTIKNNYAKVYKACSNNETFLNLFMDMFDKVK